MRCALPGEHVHASKMYLLLLFLLTPAIFSHDVVDYLNKDIRYPKCCPRGYYLHYETENSTLTCYENLSINLQINAKSIENYTKNCNEKCVDFFVGNDGSVKLIIPNCDAEVYLEINNYTIYPKCCPLGYLYQLEAHKCVFSQSANFSEDQGVFVKTSLSQCKSSSAIIDHLVREVYVNKLLSIRFDRVHSGYGKYCFDESLDGRKLVRTCEDYSTACMRNFDDKGVRCLRKCCPDGQALKEDKCRVVPGYGLNIYNQSKIKNNKDYNFGIIPATNRSKYPAKEEHIFYIDSIGDLHTRKSGSWKLYTSEDAIYCMEYANENNYTDVIYYLYSQDEPPIERLKFDLSVIVLSISCVFAMATVFCYMILPEMHNLYGKSLMMYCLVLTLAFSVLAYVQFEYKLLSECTCATLGFLLQFSFLACFSWLNVICFDMWMAFGQMRVNRMSSKKKDLKRFIYYNIYAWSIPTIITLFSYTIYKTKCLPDYLVPHLGTLKCFFDKRKGTYDYFVFFIGPLALLIVVNIIFCVKTIMYCFQVKNQINKMKTSPTNDEARGSQKLNADVKKLVMLIKLCLIMGVNWLFEIISSIISFKANTTTQTIEAIWDIFNCMQGVFIFCIFILKRNILKSLRNKIMPTGLAKRSSEISTARTSVTGNAKVISGQNGRKSSEAKITAA